MELTVIKIKMNKDHRGETKLYNSKFFFLHVFNPALNEVNYRNEVQLQFLIHGY